MFVETRSCDSYDSCDNCAQASVGLFDIFLVIQVDEGFCLAVEIVANFELACNKKRTIRLENSIINKLMRCN